MTTIRERFWSKVSLAAPDACWEWTGYRTPKGYGRLTVANRPIRAHRLAFELHHGGIPAGRVVCHRCDNRACVNPAHLFLGTRADNNADMIAKNRSARGERAPNAKLTREQVLSLWRQIQCGTPHRVLARDYGVTAASVWAIATGKSWAWLTGSGSIADPRRERAA